MTYYKRSLGIDLGKVNDNTVLVSVYDDPVLGGGLICDGLTVLPLGTSYTDVARHIEQVAWRLRGNVEIAVDATGLGATIVDMLKATSLTCELAPVIITAGERTTHAAGRYRVPKTDLISRLQMLFEKGRLRIAKDLKHRDRLVRELLDFRTETLAGRKEHDDLVMALSLACWQATRARIGFGEGRIL